MYSISKYLNTIGFNLSEGYCEQIPEQVNDLINLISKQNLNVMEIGFNGGHSAQLFLETNKTLNLLSFDLGMYDYVLPAKKYIDILYPNRHTLILGDSTITVPKFISENQNIKFDVIFIDGGHEYHIAKQDIDNCFHLSHKDTIVILDDTIFMDNWKQPWNIGPTQAWIDNLEQNKIIEIMRKDYELGRGMCWGKFNFKI